MISGVSAFSTAYAPFAASAARRTQAAEQPFSVPASALRSEATQPAQAAADPMGSAIEFSRDFPQLLLNQAYAPLPIQRIQDAAGRIQSTTATASGAQSAAEGGRATPGLGQEMDEAAQGAGIPGDPGRMAAEGEKDPGSAEGSEEAESPEGGEDGKKADGENLSKDEQQQVTELKNRDREVRAHEQAHQAVGGAYAGGASYEFQQGPDGQRYAVGGEVSIDMSAERDPQATIAKMQQVKAAAMAPAQPSGQDRAVAASATATEMQARAEQSSASAEEAAGATGATEGRNGESKTEGVNGTEAASGESAGTASNNPFIGNYQQQQNRANPYAGANNNASAPGILNLPGAYRPINIVA